MKNFTAAVDKIGASLRHGFVVEFFGRRGAVLFFILFKGLIPFSSLVTALWIGIYLAVFMPTDLGFTPGELKLAVTGLVVVGLIGIYFEAISWAKPVKTPNKE